MSNGARSSQIIELVAQFAELLYRYAYRLTGNAADADDLTQQTFLRAQQRGHQLRDTAAAKSWLFAIMRNSFLTSRRHVGIVQSLDQISDPVSLAEPPEAVVDSEELQAALLELPEEFRSPLILFYFDEFSYQQIADQMGLPIGTVMSRLSRAKAFLRKRLSFEMGVSEPRIRERIAT